METKRLLSIGQVAEVLGVSASSVRLLCDSGRLPFVRPLGPSGHRRIRPQALEAYLASMESRSELPEAAIEKERYQPAESLADTIADIKKLCR